MKNIGEDYLSKSRRNSGYLLIACKDMRSVVIIWITDIDNIKVEFIVEE